MKGLIFNATFFFQIAIFLITLYYMIISLFGLYRKKEKIKNIEPEKSFALLVAAHNEEMVIGNIVDSLKKLDYPKELYDIFVIADNCSDNTARIAREHGAEVFERFDANKRGKGFALEWMFNNLFQMDKKYDAVVVFDADNLASKNFLKELNKKLCEGYKVVQGYIDSKNPHDSWISESYSISFWTANRLFQLSRSNLGLTNQIGGTGFCIDTEVLKEIGWGATCLTEDLEFTCKLVLNGEKVGWAHNAIVYDEKPLTLKQSWKQRKRWMQGFADVASRFFFKLMKKAIKDRDFVAFDCALYTIQPFIIVGLGISTILTFLQSYSANGLNIFIVSYLFTPIVWKLLSIFQFLFTPFVMFLDRKLSKKMLVYFGLYSLNIFLFDYMFDSDSKLYLILLAHLVFLASFVIILAKFEGKTSLKMFLWYLLYGVYTFTWLPITIQGILDKNNKEWIHTKHTRQISINEIENIDGSSAA
ncbi:Beta-monoglucosyldiacylglycerol synthase [Caloramator mitchellensis]|uniref:Beta-monoglucosyldiacylglycerol synthase n=1 Tax=Caloramator mitchellensis TaxID=908809 RepID=A0A0R3JV63_CALMK|nr:glycosyltransferase family 2 protein [Caloramator mitchellensis]KRQ87483.1 Beta-monoglucosyldiacylglycerol synthase [Caloramator mitchellensis]